MAVRKGTRLTDNPKDIIIRVRIDKDMVKKLDECVGIMNSNRSEVIRKGINLIHNDLHNSKINEEFNNDFRLSLRKHLKVTYEHSEKFESERSGFYLFATTYLRINQYDESNLRKNYEVLLSVIYPSYSLSKKKLILNYMMTYKDIFNDIIVKEFNNYYDGLKLFFDKITESINMKNK